MAPPRPAVAPPRQIAAAKSDPIDAFDKQMLHVSKIKGRVLVYGTDGENPVEARLLMWRPRKDRHDKTSDRTDYAIIEWTLGVTTKVPVYLVQPADLTDKDSGFHVHKTVSVAETVVCNPPGTSNADRWERKMLKWLASHDIAAVFDGPPAARFLIVPGVDRHIPVGCHRRLTVTNGQLSAPPPASAASPNSTHPGHSHE